MNILFASKHSPFRKFKQSRNLISDPIRGTLLQDPVVQMFSQDLLIRISFQDLYWGKPSQQTF